MNPLNSVLFGDPEMIRKRTSEDISMQKEYKYWMGRYCCNPECGSGVGIETHHIIPMKNGGPSKFWNFITLCWKCHRKGGLHRGNESVEMKLFVWKCMRENEIYGFILDEEKNPFIRDCLDAFRKENLKMFPNGGRYVEAER